MRPACTILMMSVMLVLLPRASAQGSADPIPKVVQHSEPVYPPLARQTRTQGDVLIKVSTDGESVRDAVAQTCHPLLCKAAEDNVKTWKFASTNPKTFDVTFRYKLLEGNAVVEFLELPALVRVLAVPPEISIDYAYVGLGTWKAQMKSEHGRFQRVFDFSYTGADADWLNARTLTSIGEGEESDFGHKDGDLIAFTITLFRPDSPAVKVFFVGKITGNKIVGTFVDATGVVGKWTAIRTPDGPNSAIRN